MRLRNGATVIHRTSIEGGYIVLAITSGHNEYVTWVTGEDGAAYSGHYNKNFFDAVEEYKDRINSWRKA